MSNSCFSVFVRGPLAFLRSPDQRADFASGSSPISTPYVSPTEESSIHTFNDLLGTHPLCLAMSFAVGICPKCLWHRKTDQSISEKCHHGKAGPGPRHQERLDAKTQDAAGELQTSKVASNIDVIHGFGVGKEQELAFGERVPTRPRAGGKVCCPIGVEMCPMESTFETNSIGDSFRKQSEIENSIHQNHLRN